MGAFFTPGRRCHPSHRDLYGRRLPLLNGQPSTPLKHSIGGDWDYEAYEDSLAFTRPAFPSPVIPGWNGTLRLLPRASHPTVTHDARQGGDDPFDTGPDHTLINSSLQSVSSLTACDISRRTVALPVTGDRPVLGLGGPFAEHDVGGDMALRLVPRPFPRFAQRATGAQAGHQLTLERAASLDVERLVDRLVADAHVDIVGEVQDQPPGDLLRTPGRGPAPIGPVRLVQPLPGRGRAGHDGPIRTLQLPAQPGPDVVLKPWIAGQLRRLRAPRRGLRLPLRDTRPVVGLAAAGRGVAPHLPRDRPGIAPELPGDLTDAVPLRLECQGPVQSPRWRPGVLPAGGQIVLPDGGQIDPRLGSSMLSST